MKIKLLKDIPGYKAGEILSANARDHIYRNSDKYYEYSVISLMEDGWAEEAKDEIDMEEVRRKIGPFRIELSINDGFDTTWNQSKEEWDFFKAFLVIKHVIDTLNGEEKINTYHSYELLFNIDKNKIDIVKTMNNKMSLLPFIKDKQTAEKVISLCEPELRILFSVEK